MVVKLNEKLKDPTLAEVKKFVSENCFESNIFLAVFYLFIGLSFYSVSIFLLYTVWVNQYYLLYPIAWFVAGTASISLFVLGHDSAHESFTSSKRLNSFLGHILFLPTLYPYYAWKYSHNAHHNNTNKFGSPADSIYYDNAWIPLTIKQYKILNKRYPFRGFLYRLSRSVLMVGSSMHNFIYHYFPEKFNDEHKKNVYFSYIILSGLVILAFALTYYYTNSFLTFIHFFILPAFFAQFWMSLYTFLHHTSEDAEFYEAETWSQYKGQILSTINCLVPRWISFLHFNIDIHTPHHMNIRIPSYRLRKAYIDLKNSPYGKDIKEIPFSFSYYFKTIKECKLWDNENKKYVSFEAIK